MSAFFIAGAGTDVGKTHVTAGLIRALIASGRDVEALKPLVSGFDPEDWAGSDPGRLLAALGRPLDLPHLDRISPWRFRAPLSPDMAAAREGAEIDLEGILALCAREAAASGDRVLMIEGVGGVMSPLSPATTNLDWIRALQLPVLLVVGSYLGSISHTLTAVEVILATGLPLAAVAVSESLDAGTPFDETLASLGRLSGAPVFAVPRDASETVWAAPIIEALLS
ncbi:MAG: dethiobiotin synthase [Caulobacteraceae bacterium]|nr:dethiobiotin synthase [Caulobacteraceae bacterium]